MKKQNKSVSTIFMNTYGRNNAAHYLLLTIFLLITGAFLLAFTLLLPLYRSYEIDQNYMISVGQVVSRKTDSGLKGGQDKITYQFKAADGSSHVNDIDLYRASLAAKTRYVDLRSGSNVDVEYSSKNSSLNFIIGARPNRSDMQAGAIFGGISFLTGLLLIILAQLGGGFCKNILYPVWTNLNRTDF